MSGSGFGPGDVLNRRVNTHINELLPNRILSNKDYYLDGRRFLQSDSLPGQGDECRCSLESYVGKKGKFEIHLNRVFEPETAREWRITNTISRPENGSGSPFTYIVESQIEIMGDLKSDQSRVAWADFDEEPLFGGPEAQAAILLTEKMSHRRARENGNGRNHAGSLSRLGSLADIIDTGRQLRTDWEAVSELLGPDAETIAATVGFEAIESSEKRVAAAEKGIDFLNDDLTGDGEGFEPANETTRQNSDRPAWKTPPAHLSVEETEEKVQTLNEDIRQMKQDLDAEN
jgi:hypothetical protein